jgi:hypothetical protein
MPTIRRKGTPASPQMRPPTNISTRRVEQIVAYSIVRLISAAQIVGCGIARLSRAQQIVVCGIASQSRAQQIVVCSIAIHI